MPRTAMFAAHHGQKRSLGFPFRSAVEMTLMPLSSTCRPSRGRTMTSVAIAAPSNNECRRVEILLPAAGPERLELGGRRAARRALAGHRVGGRSIGEPNRVTQLHALREAGQARPHVYVSRAAGIHGVVQPYGGYRDRLCARPINGGAGATSAEDDGSIVDRVDASQRIELPLVEAEQVCALEDRIESIPRYIGDERPGVEDDEEVTRQRRGVLRDCRTRARIREVVARHVDRVAIPVGDAAQRLGFDDGVGAGDRDEGPLAVGLDHRDRPARVEVGVRRLADRDPFARELGAHQVAERPRAMRPRVEAGQAEPGGRGQHVERAAYSHRALRGEHIAASLGQVGERQHQVDEHAAERDEPSYHLSLSASRRATIGSKSRSFTTRTLRTAAGGSFDRPVHAPVIAPAIAAMVSVSPPRAAAVVHARQGSPWQDRAIAKAVGTDSAVSTPVPSTVPCSNSSAKPKWPAARIAGCAASSSVAPSTPAETTVATTAAPACAMAVSCVTRSAATTASSRRSNRFAMPTGVMRMAAPLVLPSRPVCDGSSPADRAASARLVRSEEHTSELQSRGHLVCRLLLEKKKKKTKKNKNKKKKKKNNKKKKKKQNY